MPKKAQYEKHYPSKDFNLISTHPDGTVRSIEVEGKILIRRGENKDKTIYYLYCANARKSKIECSAHCRIKIPVKKDSKAELIKEHNNLCLLQEMDDEEKSEHEEKREIKNRRSIESTTSAITPTKDDSIELINREINIIVSQEPEITEKELRERLQTKFNDKKLPRPKNLDNKINSIRRKLGTSTLDFVRRRNKTEEGFPFLRFLSTTNMKINDEDVEFTTIIWMSNFQMLRFRSAEHIYVDGSFDVVPKSFKQLITVLAEDPITKFGVPVAFLLVDSKKKVGYELAFEALKSIVTSRGQVQIKLKSVTLDFEKNFFYIRKKPSIKMEKQVII